MKHRESKKYLQEQDLFRGLLEPLGHGVPIYLAERADNEIVNAFDREQVPLIGDVGTFDEDGRYKRLGNTIRSFQGEVHTVEASAQLDVSRLTEKIDHEYLAPSKLCSNGYVVDEEETVKS